jgi:hypothetical protein
MEVNSLSRKGLYHAPHAVFVRANAGQQPLFLQDFNITFYGTATFLPTFLPTFALTFRASGW